MRKIIWACWLQGIEKAPNVVQRCLGSWSDLNPGWDLRILNAKTLRHYIDINEIVDLQQQQVTHASLSDIIRILLLHEYGGVWVDATTLCNIPLDDWVSEAAATGFFAFEKPAPDRLLSSWFLVGDPFNPLIQTWAAATAQYWDSIDTSTDYFWFHHLFSELVTCDAAFKAAWEKVPRLSAQGPHALQANGRLYRSAHEVEHEIDWSTPLFKLTYRLDDTQYRPDCLLHKVLDRHQPVASHTTSDQEDLAEVPTFGSISVATENLGDHMQILASHALLKRLGQTPSVFIDRDNEIASRADLDNAVGKIPIILNGWFKTNPAAWPPHAALDPLYLGFHIRLFQSPSLVGAAAIEHYKNYAPIGCRDVYTQALLAKHGVRSFVSHCLTLSLPRRLAKPQDQTEVFVVSRDERIRQCIPTEVGPYTFINHYSGCHDFSHNMNLATSLLSTYRDRARLIVTTLLHCALPAIAMGIPVVVFYPLNSDQMHASDRERFSSLERLLRVFTFDQAADVDWHGALVDVVNIKLRLLDVLLAKAKTWRLPNPEPIAPIAPSHILPLPDQQSLSSYLAQPKRLMNLAAAGVPDRERWGNPQSYKSAWGSRAALAATFIPPGVSLFEIGVGGGQFRDLVAQSCGYLGADLEPIAPGTIRLDLDNDPLPDQVFDFIVLLGVFEYLHHTHAVADKLAQGTRNLLISYCCVLSDATKSSVLPIRRSRGWVNEYTRQEIVYLFALRGLAFVHEVPCNNADDFQQIIMHFRRH
ncbi:MAG: polysaccharide pyruvyl transferase family protein [Tildeniella nuda ZEHNDER 1965/U140]|nr:polysaccharide pyruvyl transferase family protein [Tildeniella nuda ZEHNDER 1965/U140]